MGQGWRIGGSHRRGGGDGNGGGQKAMRTAAVRSPAWTRGAKRRGACTARVVVGGGERGGKEKRAWARRPMPFEAEAGEAKEEWGSGAGGATRRKGGFWRSARVAAIGARRSQGRASDTDPDTSGWAAWGCSVLCVSSAEEERGKEMRLTCAPREFKLNFRNSNSNQNCFDPQKDSPKL
jgi:hypothetical protein